MPSPSNNINLLYSNRNIAILTNSEVNPDRISEFLVSLMENKIKVSKDYVMSWSTSTNRRKKTVFQANP